MQHSAHATSIKFDSNEDFIVVFKPQGMRIKKVSEKQLGLLDVLSARLKLSLFTVYDMVDTSSGLLLLAKSADIAKKLKDQFQNTSATYLNEIQFSLNEKKYHFACPDRHDHLFQNAWQSLNRIYHVQSTDCYRLIHDLKHEIQADIYGEVLWVYWYRETAPTAVEQKDIFDFAQSIQKSACIRHMVNRGYGVGGQETEKLFPGSNAPKEWVAQENNPPYLAQYKLKQNSGFSPGLFLDQRENRTWVYQNTDGKKVLNLFSYTSGFSVAAALGKATQVTTVDASPSFLEWSKENFKLNHLDFEQHEFFCQDTLLFLAGSLKRARKWDLMICDPPSFGRTKTTVWKIEKDLPELATAMWKCLNVKGTILFTCNYEKWNLDDVIKNFSLKLKKDSFRIESLPAPGLDLELPDTFSNLTKGFLVRKLQN